MFKKMVLFLLLPVLVFGKEQKTLSREDIHKVMKEILSQHIEKKKMDGNILLGSFKVYFEQFDPEKIYLLQSEVEPFFNMPAVELEKAVAEYNQDNYTVYRKINEVIQKAIVRARKIRADFETNPKELMLEALKAPSVGEEKKKLFFASNELELKGKIRNFIIDFLQFEVKKIGEKKVKGFESQALMLYEKQVRSYEDNYLFTESNGKAIPDWERENLFTLHILKALAKSLDAHTAFFDNQEAYDMKVRLEKGFEGIGIGFQETPQGVMVASIVAGSPADKDGQVKAGDLLIEINGVKTGEVSFEKAMKLLKGEKDEPISLVFKRMGEKGALPKILTVNLKRETIVLNENRVEYASEKFGDGIIGRITLHSFYQNDKGITSEKDVKNAIQELKSQGNLRGLILDLRENSGGFLSQAVKVAGLFITNGVVVISKYSSGEEKIYRDMDGKVDFNGPLIVLTSRATASAAEIVAQALQDYGVALVVGDEQTYGKGTIQSQTVTDNKGSSFFKVTVGKYYTVSGKTPQLNGVKADVVVPGPYSAVRLGEEYLDHAILEQDKITPSFADPLKDIDPSLRPWYLRYYIPSLQHKTQVWRNELAQLQKNSRQRIIGNKNYQAFLRLIQHKDAEPLKPDLEEESSSPKNFGSSDLQLAEAYNIIKDMIYLAPQARIKEYMVGAELSPEESFQH